MRRFLNPFVLILTAFMALVYFYAALRLTESSLLRALLAVPFLIVWLTPILYWMGKRREKTSFDNVFHIVSYVGMGWISFLVFFLLLRDLLLLLATPFIAEASLSFLTAYGGSAVVVLASLVFFAGVVSACRGPVVQKIDIKINGLPEELNGFSIAQISDLHIGPTIGRSYVEKVVRISNELGADLIALTGDIVDGSVEALAAHTVPLSKLRPKEHIYMVLGNHDIYSGAEDWIQHFKSMGIKLLLNSHMIHTHNSQHIMVAGVLDPAIRMVAPHLRPDPHEAIGNRVAGPENLEPAFRLLLAHNPKIAAEAAEAGFELQLSGHTHAGQFFPWNIVTRLVHAPHFAGLSKQDRMWVYVNTGTGSWGPPIRVGTRTEISLIRLCRSDSDSSSK